MDSAFICKANDQAQDLAFVRKILYHPAGWHGPLDIDGWESHEWNGKKWNENLTQILIRLENAP